MNTSTPMRCPICTTELIRGEDRHYETFDEHVCNPNAWEDIPKRDTYVCKNTRCDAFKNQLFWNPDGDLYNRAFDKEYEFIDNNPGAIPSISRRLHVEIFDKSQNTTILRTKKLMINKLAVRKADEFGNVLECSYHHDVWVNHQNKGYVLWIPGYRMLIYCIRSFYRDCKLYNNTEKGKQLLADKILEYFDNSIGNQWWRKVTRLWIILFHRKLLREVIATAEKMLNN